MCGGGGGGSGPLSNIIQSKYLLNTGTARKFLPKTVT